LRVLSTITEVLSAVWNQKADQVGASAVSKDRLDQRCQHPDIGVISHKFSPPSSRRPIWVDAEASGTARQLDKRGRLQDHR
jgi:hypothetical protein